MLLAREGTAALAALSSADYPARGPDRPASPAVIPDQEFSQGLAIILEGLANAAG